MFYYLTTLSQRRYNVAFFYTLISRKRLFKVSRHKVKHNNFQTGWILFVCIVQCVSSSHKQLPLTGSSGFPKSLTELVLLWAVAISLLYPPHLHLAVIERLDEKHNKWCPPGSSTSGHMQTSVCSVSGRSPVVLEGSACARRTGVTMITTVWPVEKDHQYVSVVSCVWNHILMYFSCKYDVKFSM